jgi:hypothetical protein
MSDADGNSRFPRWVLIALLIGIGLVVGAFLATVFSGSPTPSQPVASQDATPPPKDRDTTTERPKPPGDSRAPAGQPRQPAVAGPHDGGDESKQPDPADSEDNHWTYRFQNSQGEPAGGVVIEVDSIVQGHSTPVEFRIGEDGTLSLPASHNFHVFRVKSKNWRVTDALEIGLRPGWYRLVRDRGSGRTGVLDEVRTLTVSIEYADGLAYEGEVVVSSSSGNQEHTVDMGATRRFPATGGQAEVEIPLRGLFRIVVGAQRPGFQHGVVTFEDGERPGDSLRIILERDEVTHGFIEVDLGEFGEDEEVRVIIDPYIIPYDTRRRDLTNGNRIHRTRGLKPGKYRAYVRSPGWREAEPRTALMWASEVIELEAGDVKRVQARRQLAASIRARIVDEHGQPFELARIRVDRDRKVAPTWNNWRGDPPDEHGVVQYNNAEPGTYQVECVAPEYGIESREVELLPGQEYDLGLVQLVPATGAIEVVITNWDPEVTYEVSLSPWVSTIMIVGPVEMEGPTYRFERLYKRWYAIRIRALGSDLRSHYQNVRLSEEEPVKQIEVEMRTVRRRPQD